MKLKYIIVLWGLISIAIFSCSISKKLDSINNTDKPLMIDPYNYHKVSFNSNWISSSEITRIIEKEYLDGRKGKLHLITILDFDSNGYVSIKYNGHEYPKNDAPDETNIFSKVVYETEINNSFVTQKWRTIRYLGKSSNALETDTLYSGWKVFNTAKSKIYKNSNNEIITKYEYDAQNRIVKEISGDGEEIYSIIYHSKNKIEIKQYSNWFKGNFSSWITIDNQGRITMVYDESNKSTHEFKYDNLGFMIEDKHWFKDKEPNYHVYEYIKKKSR